MKHVYAIAESYHGLKEYPGAKHNAKILSMFARSGHNWVKEDETPWCAAFVGACLGEAGLKSTGKLNARSYLKWGVPVKFEKAQKGDVVILWRKSYEGPLGHVGFFHDYGKDMGYVELLGGNQGDEVSIKEYSTSRILGIRRARPKKQKIRKSKTMQASATALAATGCQMLSHLGGLDPIVQYILVATAGIAAVALIVVMRERIIKWNEGDD